MICSLVTLRALPVRSAARCRHAGVGAPDWRVLDSLRDGVQGVGERRDQLPRLLFNELQIARWEAGGHETVLGGPELLQPWHRLLTRARLLDSVALVLRIHAL